MRLVLLVAAAGIATASYGAVGDTSICRWAGCRQAAFTPTYDDMPQSGWFSLKDGFAPLHETYRLKGSAAIVTGAKFPDGFGWADLKAILDQGWLEPISHTHTHPSLPSLTAEEIRREMQTSIEVLTRETGRRIETMAYPFGHYDDRVRAEAATFFVSSRSFTPGWNPFDTKDYHTIKTPWIISDTTADEAAGWFTKALADGDWLVTTGHSMSEFNDGWEPTPRAVYERSLKEGSDLVAKGLIWNDTYTEVAKYLRERNESSVDVVSTDAEGITLRLNLASHLSRSLYSRPLTLKSEVPAAWQRVLIAQGTRIVDLDVDHSSGSATVMFEALPGGPEIRIEPKE